MSKPFIATYVPLKATNSIQVNDGIGNFVEIFHSCDSREAKDCKCSDMPRIFLNYESARSLRNALNDILEISLDILK